jgi:RelA/SpoT family (p)ppGpp synthetase
MWLKDKDVPELFASAPAVVENANAFFSSLTTFLKPTDIHFLVDAFIFSEAAHRGQLRHSGEPYITHPLAVAGILASLRLDPQALASALLHDVMEDSGISKMTLTERFGKSVAELVDGLSKIEQLEFRSKEEAQAENFRKMLLAMGRDIRVILIKLADRLHNMRTMGAVRPDKQKRIARETMEIYAPIANRIGLNDIYQELDDTSFRYLYPNRYNVLAKAMRAARGNRREVVTKIMEGITHKLKSIGIEALITGREKHLYSIYRKMQEKQLSFSEVYDIYGFRVIVNDLPSCYLTLGALHALYKPIPGKFKDYIAIPKTNGYQSLHTTLFGPYGTPIEVQIRTHEMHKIADAGVASHWMYKSGDDHFNEAQQKTHQWLQSLLEIQSETGDAIEFLEHIKVDLFPDAVYVFTPQGKIFALPQGATTVDFAYAVHTDIGSRCLAAKINHELVPLRTKLQNGDQIEIITAAHARPNPSWLSFVATGKARSHIRHFLKNVRFDESVQLGERLLTHALDALANQHYDPPVELWERYLKENSDKQKEEILSEIGVGKLLALVVAKRLLQLSGEEFKEEMNHRVAVSIRGTEGMSIQFPMCCCPIPGDAIIGMVKKDQGLVIHMTDCAQVTHLSDREKLIDVEWDTHIDRLFDVRIKVESANERGALAQMAAAISDAAANIAGVHMNNETDKDERVHQFIFTLQVQNRLHLAQVMRALRQTPVVVHLNREREK